MSEVRAEFPVGGGVSVTIYFPGHLAPGEWDTMLRILEAMKPAIVEKDSDTPPSIPRSATRRLEGLDKLGAVTSGGSASVTTDLRGQNHPCTCGHWRTSHEDSRGPCDSCDGCLRYKMVKSDA